MRRFLLDSLERVVVTGKFLLIAGRTGTGKTRVIEAVPAAVDLESLAGHRGSSFGRLLDEQPTQIDFEIALAIALLRLESSGTSAFLLEDEGALIGRISLPGSLREKMRVSPLLIEEPVAARVQVIYEDYVIDLGARYRERYGAEGGLLHRQHLGKGLGRIKKRLGGSLHDEIYDLMQAAFSSPGGDSAERLHRQWIELLLVKYYDPMYEYQIQQRQGRVVARGSRQEIIRFAADRTGQ